MSTDTTPQGRQRVARAALWLPGLLVALGAAAATAHGLYEVTVAAQVPAVIAWLYPLITDGLALVAYLATAQLSGSPRSYAWFVVVLAAGVSGLAQASYLAGGVHTAPAWLRFGIGAWPAIAAAIVAHLLFLIAHAARSHTADSPDALAADALAADALAADAVAEVEGAASVDDRPTVQLPAVGPPIGRAPGVRPESVQPESGVQRPAVRSAPSSYSEPSEAPSDLPSDPTGPVRAVSARAGGGAPARDRAEGAARRFATEQGELPTVSRLMELADVSRGTAGEVLKALRDRPTPLHLISNDQQEAHS